MATDWQMPRRSEACQACNKSFAVGDAIRVLLYESPAGYERRDFCGTCEHPVEPPPLALWRTHRPAPSTRPAHAFDREAIFGFFLRMSAVEQPAQIQFRFVLALLLWRKRVLKFTDSRVENGAEAWHFVTVRGDQSFDVVKPELDEDQIERLSQQLETLLAGGDEQAIDAPTAVPEAGNV